MTPELLAEYLQVLRDAKLASVALKIEDLEINAIFTLEPEMGQVPAGLTSEPGAWKGPERLDSLSAFEPDLPDALE